MTICYIYHSETGHTRGVVDRCAAALGGEKIEVHDLQHYNRFSKYFIGGRRAVKGLMDPIEPSVIDVSGYDVIVIGSPVWGGRPTPAINSAIHGLQGCEGKRGVLFVTCGGAPGESIPLMKKAMEEKKVQTTGTMSLTRKDLRDDSKVNSLVDLIRTASTR